MGRLLDDDPLSRALAPPPNETPEAKAIRLRAEAQARKISEEIDETLKAERAALKKKPPVKVLLLGQSESGKSTTLKNFQMNYARTTWSEELASWRIVIQLNLLRNVHTILDLLSQEMDSPSSAGDYDDFSDDESIASPLGIEPSPIIATTSGSSPGASGSAGASASGSGSNTTNNPQSGKPPRTPLNFTEKHRILKLELLPLRRVQTDLEQLLGASSQEEKSLAGGTSVMGFNSGSTFDPSSSSAPTGSAASTSLGSTKSRGTSQELFVRSNNGWKANFRPGRQSSSSDSARAEYGMVRRNKDATARETVEIIAGCAEGIRSLWADEVVVEMLKRRKVRLETMPGFFLADVDRIAKRDYIPSDEDVMRARLRTLGVQEHKIHFNTGPAAGMDWILFDVGGSRTQRQAWFPYFDDCDAIIFLAPISCFDEKLAEDRRVNRLEDSYALWKMICSSKLLARTQIILFLNKCDLLEKKLRSGVRVKDYVPSFGGRKNDVQTVTQYFAQHFKEISKQHSPETRPFRVHLTSVIDTKATSLTLQVVEDGILQSHLRKVHLIP